LSVNTVDLSDDSAAHITVRGIKFRRARPTPLVDMGRPVDQILNGNVTMEGCEIAESLAFYSGGGATSFPRTPTLRS